MPRTSHPRFDLIIADNDGCLVAEDTSPMDLDSLAKIAAHNRLAQERRDRPLLTICSGRPQPFAEAMCRLLANRSVPCIAENGVWMYNPADNAYEMDPAITAAHRAAVRQASDWLAAEFGPRGVSQQPGKAASISLYHADTEYLKSIGPRIREEFAGRNWPLRVSMTWFYINCDLAHVSKGTGLDRLLAATGTPRQRLMGIGDTPSDLPIRERVAFFACPANAHDDIKRVADYVSPFAEARGWWTLLNESHERTDAPDAARLHGVNDAKHGPAPGCGPAPDCCPSLEHRPFLLSLRGQRRRHAN